MIITSTSVGTAAAVVVGIVEVMVWMRGRVLDAEK